MTYKLLHVRQVYIFRLQEKINRVKGPFYCIIIFPSYGAKAPYGYSIFRSQLKSTYAVHETTKSGKHALKTYTTQALFTTPRHVSSRPARSEHYRNYTASCTRLDNPSIYMPDQSPGITVLEMPHIKAALPASITEIDNILSRVDAPRQSLDVDTLVHVRHVSPQEEKHTGT
jgi:hypothetical protein